MAKYEYTVEGVDYEVEILEVEDKVAKVTVNGKAFEVELKQALKPTARPIQAVTPAPAAPKKAMAPAPKPVAPAPAPGSGVNVVAPLPGTITAINVKVGDAVKQGDTVVILEAMKMQNNIEAECDGTITGVLVNPGDSVMEGTALITIA